MPRYKIIIEYIGTNFNGWQRQDNGLSVQQIIEEAIHKFTGQLVTVHSAGRTDSGVHAFGQVAHFDLMKSYNKVTVVGAINHFVKPHHIGVLECEIVDTTFHSRFSAKKRHYLYRIINRPTKLILDLNRAWWIKRYLDIDLMQEAANYLIGHHNFTSFRSSICQASSAMRTISNIQVSASHQEIKFFISAPSFLHHMVRNIVGTLVLVGMNKWKPVDVLNVLKAQNRAVAGITAPASGLYFLKVDY